MFGIGIIGCGKIAQVRHIPEYAEHKDAKLLGFYDINLERAKALAEQYGGTAYATVEECRKVYGVEKNGFFADPKMKDPVNGDFSLKADSPARKRGSDGRDLGADMNIWKGK